MSLCFFPRYSVSSRNTSTNSCNVILFVFGKATFSKPNLSFCADSEWCRIHTINLPGLFRKSFRTFIYFFLFYFHYLFALHFVIFNIRSIYPFVYYYLFIYYYGFYLLKRVRKNLFEEPSYNKICARNKGGCLTLLNSNALQCNGVLRALKNRNVKPKPRSNAYNVRKTGTLVWTFRCENMNLKPWVRVRVRVRVGVSGTMDLFCLQAYPLYRRRMFSW